MAFPNLRPFDVTTWFHPDKKQFDATLWVINIGSDPAIGAFKIIFGYSFYSYSQSPPLLVYSERRLVVPSSTNIPPDENIPVVFPNCSYSRKEGNEREPYTFYALVDSDFQIRESNDADNSTFVASNQQSVIKLLRPPLVSRPNPRTLDGIRPDPRVVMGLSPN